MHCPKGQLARQPLNGDLVGEATAVSVLLRPPDPPGRGIERADFLVGPFFYSAPLTCAGHQAAHR